MNALDLKMWRDLWLLRGQAFAIATVMASGVAVFVMFLSTLDSLLLSRELYYRDYRFAEIFAPLKRAPESVQKHIAQIRGVDKVDTRVRALVTIDIEGFTEPVTGLISSIPDSGEPQLNRLYLRTGRLVEAARSDEVIISEAFAEAHGFQLGDKLHVTIRGKRKQLRIVGTGGSPEYIYQHLPFAMFPDHKRFGVIWMARTPLAHAYDMEGAFNHVVLTLARGAHEQDVIDRLDGILRPYGGTGAFDREDQGSHRFLESEINQLDILSGIFPIIFLGVAAFLLNVVVTRMVGTQREQIAALKAFGYSNWAVTAHFLKMIMLIVLASVFIGVLVGAWLGLMLSEVYVERFGLPFLNFELLPLRIIQATSITFIAGLFGTLAALRTAMSLKPAEAMRPEAPAVYRQTFIEALGLKRLFSAPTRMILRHIGHKPVKSLLSVLGMALACAILMSGRFSEDSMNYMMDVRFGLSARDDISLYFDEPTSRKALSELQSLPGVELGEPYRLVPVWLRHEYRSYRTYLWGFEAQAEIRRLVNTDLQPVELPRAGIVLNEYLGREILNVQPGDLITVEVLEDRQLIRQIPVVAMIREYFGTGAYMNLEALNRLMREGPAISGAHLYIDKAQADEIYQRIKDRPRVVATLIRAHDIKSFHRTMDAIMLFWTSIATVFATIITVGVVYNTARIILTERSRELASMRVLGFTRGEISYILLGELALLTLVAIPPGLLLGRGLCAYIAMAVEDDLFRMPLILEPDTYAFAALVVLIAAVVSGLLVRRRLDRLDLIEVLKTKE